MHIKAAITQELEYIMVLNVTTQMQGKQHQYYASDPHYATIARNGCTGTSAGQCEERNECAYLELQHSNAPTKS